MAATETEVPLVTEVMEAGTNLVGDPDTAQRLVEAESEIRDITVIPSCILKCLYPRVLQNGCAHGDYSCFCYEMNPVLVDPEVQICLKECPFLGEQLYAQGSIMDFCAVEDIEIGFPQFMSQYGIRNRRAVSSGIPGASQSIAPITPQPTPFTTITSTLPWGFSAYYYTISEGADGTATVVYAAADTSISTTYYVTTTIPSGQAEYTSTFTDKKSAAITKVIAITSGGSPKPTSTSTSSANPSPTNSNNPASSQTQTHGSSGLSSEAKIGIGVAVPLVFILLAMGILFFLRQRKKQNSSALQPHAEQEAWDGALPEPMSTISELKANPPSYPGGPKDSQHVEAAGVPIHEMNAAATEPRYEANGNTAYTARNELAADLPRERASLPSPAPAAETTTSSFPPPWNSSGAAEYEQQSVPTTTNTSEDRPSPAHAVEDPEIAQLEEEAARMKKKRERLQEMQELEEREEEIRRSILERKKAAGSLP